MTYDSDYLNRISKVMNTWYRVPYRPTNQQLAAFPDVYILTNKAPTIDCKVKHKVCYNTSLPYLKEIYCEKIFKGYTKIKYFGQT